MEPTSGAAGQVDADSGSDYGLTTVPDSLEHHFGRFTSDAILV